MSLVERLRYWEGDGHPHGLLHREAADELERLQQRVEVLEGALSSIMGYEDMARDMGFPRISDGECEQARAALGEGR